MKNRTIRYRKEALLTYKFRMEKYFPFYSRNDIKQNKSLLSKTERVRLAT